MGVGEGVAGKEMMKGTGIGRGEVGVGEMGGMDPVGNGEGGWGWEGGKVGWAGKD